MSASFPLFTFRPGLRAALAVVLVLAGFCTVRAGGAADMTPPTLADVKKQLGENKVTQAKSVELTEKVDTLLRQIDLKTDGLELNSETIKTLKDSAAALKASPIGGKEGFSAQVAARQPIEVKLQTDVEAAITALGKLKETADANLNAKKTARDAAKKTLDDKKAVTPAPADLPMAQTAFDTAEAVVKTAQAEVDDIAATTTEANALLDKVKTSNAGLTAYTTVDNAGSFAKKLTGFFGYGDKLVSLHKAQLTATKFPGFATDPVKADAQAVAKAFSSQSIALSRVEPLTLPLRTALDPIRLSTNLDGDGYSKLAASVVPEGTAYEPVSSAGNALCLGSRDQFNTLKTTIEALPRLFETIRAAATGEHTTVSEAVTILRNAIRQGDTGEFGTQLLDALNKMKPGLALAAEQRIADEDWPVASGRLAARWGADMVKADAAFKLTREEISRLTPFLTLIDDFRGGDVNSFVSQHVRLYYLPSVPRLIQVLSGGLEILNPEGAAAIKDAEEKEQALRQLELAMADNLGTVVSLRRRIEGALEEIRVAEIKVKNAQKQYDAIFRQSADLEAKKISAEKTATNQETRVKELQTELGTLTTEKSSLETQIKSKMDEITALNMATPVDQGKVDTATKELKALNDKLVTNGTKITQKNGEIEAAQRDLERKNADKKYYTDLFTEKEKERTDAQTTLNDRKNELSKLKGDSQEDEASLKALRRRQADTEQKINEQRRNIELDALEENKAFGEAREKAPIYISRANVLSPDPVKRVTLFGFGDSKTMLIRGKPEDVEKTLEIVAGFDAPAPQARVTLWTLQFNGDNNAKMNDRLLEIDRTMADLRSDISYYQETLRTSIGKQVNLLQQDVQYITQGTPMQLTPRMARTLFYTKEVRERLGFRLPCEPFWNMSLAFLRVKRDLDEIYSLARLNASINQKIIRYKKGEGTLAELKELRERERLYDRLMFAAFEEERSSFGRWKILLSGENLQALNCCDNPGKCQNSKLIAAKDQLVDLIAQYEREKSLALKNLIDVHRDIMDAAGDGKFSERWDQQMLSRYGFDALAYETDPGAASDEGVLPKVFRKVRRLNEVAMNQIRIIASALSDCEASSQPAKSNASTAMGKCGEVAAAPSQMAATTGAGSGTEVHAPVNTERARLTALSLQDSEYVTRWTIPDPAHSTTLGEAMFVVTLARRSMRLGVLRDFARELLRDRNISPDDKHTSKASSERYQRFVDDCTAVLQGLLARTTASSTLASHGEPGGMPRFPGLPKALLGAVTSAGAPISDDELTSNQHEVLQALLAKARSAAGTEVQHMVRQVDWYRQQHGGSDPGDGYISRLRQQYLPLVGWFSAATIDSPRDLQEIQQRLGCRCTVPQPYRDQGAERLKLDIDGNGALTIPARAKRSKTALKTAFNTAMTAADRMAWSIGREQVSGNSLAAATPRVAAADDMIKRLMKVMEDDVDHYFVTGTLEELQEQIDGRPSRTKKIGAAINKLLDREDRPVRLGIIERTSVLATNRLVARLSPNATAGLELPGKEDFLLQAQQLSQLAQGVQGGFFAKDKVRNGAAAAGSAAALAKTFGSAGIGVGPLAAISGIFSLLEEQKREPPGEVYTINSGNTFKLTPIFDPSGQALRFKFDHVAMTRVREPDGTINPLVPRVEKMSVNTEVQVSNLEVQEVARYHQNAQLGIPEKREGGVPFLRSLPILKDIPLIGYYTRQKGRAGVVQESVILGQTVIYPTVGEIVDLLVDSPRRLALGDLPPAGLWERDNGCVLTLHLLDPKGKAIDAGADVVITEDGTNNALQGKTGADGSVVFASVKRSAKYALRLIQSDQSIGLGKLEIKDVPAMEYYPRVDPAAASGSIPPGSLLVHLSVSTDGKVTPVPFYRVALRPDEPNGKDQEAETTDEGGLATFPGLKLGGRYRIIVAADSLGFKAPETVVTVQKGVRLVPVVLTKNEDPPRPATAMPMPMMPMMPTMPAMPPAPTIPPAVVTPNPGTSSLRLQFHIGGTAVNSQLGVELVPTTGTGSVPPDTYSQGLASFSPKLPKGKASVTYEIRIDKTGWTPQPAKITFSGSEKGVRIIALTAPFMVRFHRSAGEVKDLQVELQPEGVLGTLSGTTDGDGAVGFALPKEPITYRVVTSDAGVKPVPATVTLPLKSLDPVEIELVAIPNAKPGTPSSGTGTQAVKTPLKLRLAWTGGGKVGAVKLELRPAVGVGTVTATSSADGGVTFTPRSESSDYVLITNEAAPVKVSRAGAEQVLGQQAIALLRKPAKKVPVTGK